ncbi:MAG: IS630 family transposase [Nitrososphaerota archaeon]|nr:IS630 family transposase [Nitrososphaerota archaeon]
MRVAPSVELSENEERQLATWSHGRSTPQRLVLRSNIVLLAARGWENRRIARKLRTRQNTVSLWRKRFLSHRMEGIMRDAPRPGRKPRISQKKIDEIIDRTLHTKPPGATQWSTRTLAGEMGVSNYTIQQIWKAHRLQPHRQRSFKLSSDPEFNEKVRDVVGLYMNPPDRAVVVCMDEKPGIQALDRDQPVLPLRPGMPVGVSNEYVRNGTIDLFAALNILNGTVVTQLHRRHRHQEFLIFLREIDEKVPKELDVHMVLDNLATHTTPDVNRWFERHPRFKLHFVPTDASWLNMVESWFSQLTERQIRRNSFPHERALVRAIKEFVDEYQKNPRPFVWTVDADEILRKIAKLRQLRETGK